MLDDDDNNNNNNNKNDSNRKLEPTVSSSTPRYRILTLIESFIEQIFHIRKTLLGVSISAIIMAPIAIGLSVFLLRHPSFFTVLEMENEFGLVLGVLLGAIIIISSIWLVLGLRQYRLIGSWNKRYRNYVREKQAMDNMIASQYSEDTDY
jgi:hypothetical protein